MTAEPDKYFITPHYNDYPMMLVRLPAVNRDELRLAMTRAWRLIAPPGLDGGGLPSRDANTVADGSTREE